MLISSSINKISIQETPSLLLGVCVSYRCTMDWVFHTSPWSRQKEVCVIHHGAIRASTNGRECSEVQDFRVVDGSSNYGSNGEAHSDPEWQVRCLECQLGTLWCSPFWIGNQYTIWGIVAKRSYEALTVLEMPEYISECIVYKNIQGCLRRNNRVYKFCHSGRGTARWIMPSTSWPRKFRHCLCAASQLGNSHRGSLGPSHYITYHTSW
jgi:hypothetical protein